MEAVLDTLNQLKLLARVPSLKPKEDTFVSNEGDSYLLVALVGTVPIRFRTNQYNIPVEVFVVRDYPEKPPLCFVRPTRGTAYGSQHPPAYGPPPGQPAHMGGGYPGHPHPHHQPHQPPPFASGQPEGGRKRELEERMARKANDVWQAVSADVNQFHLVQQRLRDGSSWLQHSLTTLAHDKRELDEYLRAAEEKEHETRQWISESETVQLGVDDLVVPADALSAQMMELVAEDAGIEDTLYYMDKALHSNTIDLQTHLKAHIPPPLELEQFQKRALAMRVHELQKQRM
ncbi:Vps23 domain containing protein [Acanthamoeba castellanii str. Neff]|uniref:Vps23 domain containing protein n=1 Tax=Acanthamoeba castellanii (strain ATCC 30010 / Neff) TaxID=1257118 RepID=L8HE30_ACACF|nr:Vps23 domain containing protein [Acanthamoeba castellanii str. Neff]ELR23450.1 Vps23 domain containing protein [Acanthamoeba castellanii str. Neff]